MSRKKWRTEQPCENCPFNSRGPGLKLRKGLRPGRWREILLSLRMDGHFFCHKTVDYDGDDSDVDNYTGDGLICAGAIEWQQKNVGHAGQLQRVMERVNSMFPEKA